jgi:nucleotide-binding universal stress UspA family protein
MKKILLATDFSENCKSALLYSFHLAKEFNASLEIINSFVSIPAIGIDGGPGVMNESVLESGKEHNRKRMSELLSSVPNSLKADVSLSSNVIIGEPVSAISNYLDENDFDLLVMGTTGESRLEEILFGSTTVEVMKNAACPVIAVPAGAEYRGIKKIVYASDLVEKDIEVINHVCEMAKFFDAEVVVFHVFGEDNMTAQDEADEFNTMLSKNVHYDKLKKESVTYGNSYDAILEVVKKDLANMVVLREQSRGIFSRLFHPDMVKRINYHTVIPLLTYNDNSLKN